MLPGTNAEYMKAFNRRIVLDAIRRLGPLSRAEVARHTNLSPQTVSNIVGELAGEGLVILGARRTGGRGQPPVELELNRAGAYAVGLVLDRDHLGGVLIDLGGNVLQRTGIELRGAPPDEVLPHMRRVTEGLVAADPRVRSRLRGIGVALPGQMQVGDDTITIPTNFPGWEGVPLEALLRDATGLPVLVENDAAAAAIGERWFGAGRDVDSFVSVYFGIGLGAGLVIEDHLYRGHGLNAGKFGHMPVGTDGRRCSCGNVGCLELYASIGALAEKVAGARDALHPDDLARLFDGRDPVVATWLDEASAFLAQALLSVENLLDPGAIVFCGRLPARVQSELLARVGRRLVERRMRGKPIHPELMASELGEHAAAIGAATLPIYEALAPSQGLLLKSTPATSGKGGAM